MRNENDELKAAFKTLSEDGMPTSAQKDVMLRRVLSACGEEKDSLSDKLRRLVLVRPWALAFGASAVQAAALTLIFGERYTGLVLSVFGG